MHVQFNPTNFQEICDALTLQDADLKRVFLQYGYPPMWTRPNTFDSQVHIILEQQVSLASALAALNKLRERIQEVTPERVLSLTDEELKSCYFSRQKTVYVRHLAEALMSGKLDLEELEKLSNDDVRSRLNQLKGIGNWTIDIYLIFILRRTNVFPIGDLAAVNALKQLKNLPAATAREQVLEIAAAWHPYQTAATMLLWHYYLSVRAERKASQRI